MSADQKKRITMTAELASECPHCKGTGLHPEYGIRNNGQAMQCLVCFGRGFLIIKVKRFDGLRRVKGVERVFRGRGSRGNWSAYGKGVEYAQFLEYENALQDHRLLLEEDTE